MEGVTRGTRTGALYPTFKRYKRPSFELKLRVNAWVAGAPPQTSLGELTKFLHRGSCRLECTST